MGWTVSLPKSYVEALTPSTLERDWVWRWGLCRRNKGWMRSRGWALIQSDWCHKEKIFEHAESSGMHAHRGMATWGHSKKGGHEPAGREASQGTTPAYTSISDFGPPGLGEDKHVLFKLPRPCDSVMAARADRHRAPLIPPPGFPSKSALCLEAHRFIFIFQLLL